jgi:hypothetical protein
MINVGILITVTLIFWIIWALLNKFLMPNTATSTNEKIVRGFPWYGMVIVLYSVMQLDK